MTLHMTDCRHQKNGQIRIFADSGGQVANVLASRPDCEYYAKLFAAAPDMAEKLLKIHNWLLHNAESSERGAEANKRFQWLAESQLADARNFRATAKDVAAALQKAGIEL